MYISWIRRIHPAAKQPVCFIKRTLRCDEGFVMKLNGKLLGLKSRKFARAESLKI